ASVELANEIARLQACLLCRRSGEYFAHSHTSCVRVVSATLRRSRLDPEIPANDASLFQQTFQRTANCVRRNRETQALRSAGGRGDRRVNADHFTAEIDQGTTAVTRINCCIGLQQISESVAAIRSSFCTDDAVSHRFLKSKRITDGKNKISGLYHVGVGKL